MTNILYQNLIMYHGYLRDDIVEYKAIDTFALLVKLKDGSSVIYDDPERAVRNLPRDSQSMTEQEYRNEFGYRLRMKMCRQGLTQEDLSERTGIAQAQLSGYLTGRHTPSLYAVDRITKALGCSMDELTYRD